MARCKKDVLDSSDLAFSRLNTLDIIKINRDCKTTNIWTGEAKKSEMVENAHEYSTLAYSLTVNGEFHNFTLNLCRLNVGRRKIKII
jgi:hypothetical protein